MTETKFTPGPWFISRKFVVGPRDQEDGQSYGMIVGVADVYGENRSADANLIAAAPELYAALEAIGAPDETDLVSVPDSVIRGLLYATINIAKDALAKARGEA